MSPRTPLAAIALAALAHVALAQNQAPTTPTITEPQPSTTINPYDLHMETGPFADPNPGDTHVATDWEVWTVSPSQRIWRAAGVTGPEKIHAHLGDGVFEGSHLGWTRLFGSTTYQLRVRHRDSSGIAASEWSAYATRQFTTVAVNQALPLSLGDIASDPAPRWVDGNGGAIELPFGAFPATFAVETMNAQNLLRYEGSSAPGNLIVEPGPLPQHAPIRVRINAGFTGGNLVLPPTTLTFATPNTCQAHELLLPAVSLVQGQTAIYWISLEGASYVGSIGQSSPDFTTPGRNFNPPYIVRQPGYTIEQVADNLRLPINIAFKPNAGSAPTDPKFYVTEMYGAVKTVLNDGTVLTYASNLLNYTPSGAFPGSGEQGVTGIAVDPVSGDVFVAQLYQTSGQNNPRIVRFTSTDGGRTASSQSVILNMPGEPQGQSHLISRLEIVGGVLYAHNGDGFNSATARSLTSYRGKILCLNLDGSPVVTNPYYNGGTINARDYVYCLGVRNPFGGAWRESDGFRYLVENGPSIDRFTRLVSGRDYLWAGSDSQMTNFALHNWSPSVGPVNLAFVQPGTFGGSGFPADKMDHGFVTESGPTYAEGQQGTGKRITEWVLDGNGNRIAGPIPFVEYIGDGFGSVIGLAAGPDGLYFTDLYRDLNTTGPTVVGGRVFRVRWGSARDCDADGNADWCEIATTPGLDCNQNQVLDSCDIAGGTSTDFDQNGRPDECDLLQASIDHVSAATGGQIQFTLRAGAGNAGRIYALAGTLSGTTPGQQFGAVTVPLNLDSWFLITTGNFNSPWFQNTFGTLDANGGAAATLVAPTIPAALVGFVAHHAYVVYDQPSATFVLASNAVPARIDP